MLGGVLLMDEQDCIKIRYGMDYLALEIAKLDKLKLGAAAETSKWAVRRK
jgi:hypothetical protein